MRSRKTPATDSTPVALATMTTMLARGSSVGAVVGAMITMFAAVSQRTGEIGTLRALGFRRGAVLVAFLGESLLLALVGGLMGLAGASLMQTVNISTTNFQTFAELAFQFKLTPGICHWVELAPAVWEYFCHMNLFAKIASIDPTVTAKELNRLWVQDHLAPPPEQNQFCAAQPIK